MPKETEIIDPFTFLTGKCKGWEKIFKPENEIIHECCDWKDNLDKDEKKRLRDHVRIARDGFMSELDVTTGDERVFAAGPSDFFDWYEEQNYCAQEFFLDSECIHYPEGSEDEDEYLAIGTLYWFKGKLYVAYFLQDDIGVIDATRLEPDGVIEATPWFKYASGIEITY